MSGAAPRVRLVLALHFHQPVGNFDSVFERAVERSYRPLVEHMERHPGVRAAFHLSGCLIEWLEGRDRKFLERVIALVGSGQVEPLGGGFYEPILTVIPREDALDQIERLASWWRRRAGTRPRGVWIAERVWEPSLADLLAEAGVEYTILDDQHLRFAGLIQPRFEGLYVTERAGRSVAFLPSDFQLRYLIPFRPIEQVRAHLEEAARAGADAARGTGPGAGAGAPGGTILTYGDDAEKFGLWPETEEWVYGRGWLESFFALLEDPLGPAIATAPGSILDLGVPATKVYVPNASYTEMLEWALPAASVAPYARARVAAEAAGAEAARAFVRGSLWDMFLARYPEADQMHKHVLWSSRRARALPQGAPGKARAVTAALRAQCNCAYWHGLFGGIYYGHLRHGVYHALLDADAVLAARQKTPVSVEVFDLDGDREREVVIRSGRMQAFFRPADGGTLTELDDLEARFNVANVVSRWREAYHDGSDIVHAGDGEGSLASPHERAVGVTAADLEGRAFDRLPLRGLRDVVGRGTLDPARLARMEGIEPVTRRPLDWEPTTSGFRLGSAGEGLEYAKSVAADGPGAIRVRYDLERLPQGAWFGTLLPLTLLTPRDEDRSRVVVLGDGSRLEGPPGDALEADGAVRLVLEDRVFGFALEVEIAPPARLVAAPIETLQRAEVRFEAAYQGTIFALCWPAPRAGGPRAAAGDAPAIRMLLRPPAGREGSRTR